MCPLCWDVTEQRWGLCRHCAAHLVPAPTIRLPTGVLVGAAFRHEGLARRLVHRLKYGADGVAARLLGEAMAGSLPAGGRALVPVPRAAVRRWRYGIDPALALATALGGAVGLPVVRCLHAGWWWPRHAGPWRQRSTPVLRAVASASGVILVDDVVTTGATVTAAARALSGNVEGAVAATLSLASGPNGPARSGPRGV